MLYELSVYLLQPYTLALGLLWLFTLRLGICRREARGRFLAIVSALTLLTVISLPAVGYLAIGSLEWRYPHASERPPDAQAIVVLGGATRLMDASGERVILAGDSMVRCLHTAELYRSGGHCPIVLTGGKVEPDLPGPTVARAMHDFLLTQGVAAADMLVEESSTSTYENACQCEPILRQQGLQKIVLVTDALHMYRAARCFQAIGIEVAAAPCNDRAAYFEWSAASFAPGVGGLDSLTGAAHEWLGIAWYWLHGRI
jgi:uncharacterized SAM-binding protein YcdF (DUF218 family)